MYVINTLCNML